MKCMKGIFYLLLSTLMINYSFSQEACINADFENGNLDGWTTTGIVEIVTGSLDYYGGFPVSAPGGNYSLKLGNSITFPQPLSTAQKSFTVSEEQPYIIYQFALVNFGYPHAPIEAARSSFRILDDAGNEIPCTFFEVFAATGGPPGFQLSPRPPEANLQGQCCYEISYLEWNSVLIDLRPFINKEVTIELSNKWCIYGPDWGYSYFDAQCTGLEMAQSCDLGDTITLKAPNAASSYQWNTGDTTQFIEIVDFIPGTNYVCHLTYDGIGENCEDINIELNEKIFPKSVTSLFSTNSSINCTENEIKLNNLSTSQHIYTADSINYTITDTFPQNWYWIYGNNQVNTEKNPTIEFNDPGTHTISLISFYDDCVDTSSITITVYKKLDEPVLSSSTTYCFGGTITLQADSIPKGQIHWSGPNGFNSNTLVNTLIVEEENVGYYYAFSSNDTCPSNIVGIYVSPENKYSFKNRELPNIITPNNDSINEYFQLVEEFVNCYEYEIKFYDRWGNLVHTQQENKNPFNGRNLDNNKLNEGVYFYTVTFRNRLTHKMGEKSGFVHVTY